MKVLKFGAVWCSACLIMGPRWEKIEEELAWLQTEYHDVDQEPELAKKYRLTDYPAFIFLDKKNNEFHRLYGEVDQKELIDFCLQNKNK